VGENEGSEEVLIEEFPTFKFALCGKDHEGDRSQFQLMSVVLVTALCTQCGHKMGYQCSSDESKDFL